MTSRKGLIKEALKGDISRATNAELSEELQRRGMQVKLKKKTGEGEVRIPEVVDKDVIKFAVASDPHLGSHFQQLTHLRTFYKYAKKQGAQFVLNPGDFVEGSHRMHKDAAFYQHVHGAEAQIDYAVNHYPDDLPTYGISGNHDFSFWNDAGVNVVKQIADRREDITHIGDLGATVHLGPLNAYLWHPMGGASYARSYKLQKWIEQRPVDHRPDIVFGGHIHVTAHLPAYGGVEGFLCGCFQAQTPFINRLALNPDVCGLILELGMDAKGRIRRLVSEWVQYPIWKRDDWK